MRERADLVDLDTLTADNFRVLLEELFYGGITRERVIVLFFFCSDLTIRIVKSGFNKIFSKVSKWTFDFIREVLAKWIRIQGGWSQVLRTQNPLVEVATVIGVACLVMMGISMFAKRFDKRLY